MLLIKFGWSDVDRVRRIAEDAECGVELFVAVDASNGYGFVSVGQDRRATTAEGLRAFTAGIPEARAILLETKVELPGASAGMPAPFRYVVETDVEAEHEDDFNRWYDEEHLPGLAAVPGTVRAWRLRDPVGSPRYYAWYDLVTVDTYGSAPWLAVRETPWGARVRPAFRNTRRTMFRHAAR